MNLKIHIRPSFVLAIIMTSFNYALSGSNFLQAATNRKASSSLFGVHAHPLFRTARSLHRHMPCVMLSQLSDIKSRFEQWMDKDQNGRANLTEVRNFLSSLKHDLSDHVVVSFIGRRDENGNGEIDLIPEYVQEIVGNDYGSDAAKEWFYLHDSNDDGFVSVQELIDLGVALGMSPEMSEQTAVGYYIPLDFDGDGKLSFKEFKQIYEPPTMPTV